MLHFSFHVNFYHLIHFTFYLVILMLNIEFHEWATYRTSLNHIIPLSNLNTSHHNCVAFVLLPLL